jgi:mevalonate kinase
MLSGEYSVLNGGRALSCTVDSKISVDINEIDHFPGIIVQSKIWKNPLKVLWEDISSSLEPSVHIFKTIELENLVNFSEKKTGLELTVDSNNFDVSYGIGSSSAVRISILHAISKLFKLNLSSKEISKISYLDQLKTQGKASGYDILTQVNGGLIISEPLDKDKNWKGDFVSLEKHGIEKTLSNLHVFVGGSGAPTADLVKKTVKSLEDSGKFNSLSTASEELIECFTKGAGENNIISQFKKIRDIFKTTPAFPTRIESALKEVSGYDKTFGWKTTGAGGEDAILVYGSISSELLNALDEIGYKIAPFNFGIHPSN